MPIIGIDNDIVSSNFVSSDLIDDTGIEAPTEQIKALCEATTDYQLFVSLINNMSLNEVIDSYNFFDAFCINKALIKIIKNQLKSISSVDHDYDTIIYRGHKSMCSIQLDVPFSRFQEATKMICDSGYLIGKNPDNWVPITINDDLKFIIHERFTLIRYIIPTFGSNKKVTFVKDYYTATSSYCDYVYNVCAYEKRNK